MRINDLHFGKKGLPLVFLHGWQQDGRSFLPLIPFLQQNYRLFFLDLPGFGQSETPPLDFSSFDYARVITDWLKKKKFKKIVLVGHSFGGKIAAIMAAQNFKPIAKLILISNSGLPSVAKWSLLKKLVPDFFLKRIPKRLKMIFASRDYKEAGLLLPIFKTVVKEDISQELTEIKVPTLIIWGKDDQEIPLKDGQKMKKLIPKSRLVVVNGDHFPFWHDPQKIADLIKNFIEK